MKLHTRKSTLTSCRSRSRYVFNTHTAVRSVHETLYSIFTRFMCSKSPFECSCEVEAFFGFSFL